MAYARLTGEPSQSTPPASTHERVFDDKSQPLGDSKAPNVPDLENPLPEDPVNGPLQNSSQGLTQANLQKLRKCQQLFLCLSMILIYGLGDGLWQAADDQLGNDEFMKNKKGLELALAYLERCLADGGAQLAGNFFANIPPAFFDITNRWTRWEFFSSFFTGAFWQLFSDLGKFLGGGLSMEGEPYSTARILTTIATIGGGNYTTLWGLDKLKKRFHKNEKETISQLDEFKSQTDKSLSTAETRRIENEAKPQISKIADTLSAIVFWAQGPLPKQFSGTDSGVRSASWAALFSGLAAGATQGVVDSVNYFRRRK